MEWGTINTALILALIGFLWKQSGKVDAIYQALFGINGQQGLIGRVEKVEDFEATVDNRIGESRHLLRNEFTVGLGQLAEDFEKRLNRERRPGR